MPNPTHRYGPNAGLDILAPGVEVSPEVAEDIASAAEFLAAADEAVEIGQQMLQQRIAENREARAALEAAEAQAQVYDRAQDHARTKFVAVLKAAGLVRTADGIKPGTIDAPSWPGPAMVDMIAAAAHAEQDRVTGPYPVPVDPGCQAPGCGHTANLHMAGPNPASPGAGPARCCIGAGCMCQGWQS